MKLTGNAEPNLNRIVKLRELQNSRIDPGSSRTVDGMQVPKSHFDRMTDFAFQGYFGMVERQARLTVRDYSVRFRDGDQSYERFFASEGEAKDFAVRMGQTTAYRNVIVSDSWAVNSLIHSSTSGTSQQDRALRTEGATISNKIEKRKLLALPLHPVIEAYKSWLESGISQDCINALKKAGLWNNILAGSTTLPIHDINKISNRPTSDFVGIRQGKIDMGTWLGNRVARTYKGYGPGSGPPGLFSRGGEWTFDGRDESWRFYLLLHENAHLVQREQSGDFDAALSQLLGLQARKGESDSDALTRYFNVGHCDPKELK